MTKKKYTLKQKLLAIGPGALVVASFTGPGTITTGTVAGAGFGYTLLWAVVFAVLATILLQYMAAKLGVVTQKGLGEAIIKQFENPIIKNISIILVGGSIYLGCAAYIGGDFTGTALGLSTITGIPSNILGPIIGVVVFFLVLKGSIGFLTKFLLFLVAVMAFVFVATMFIVQPNIGGVAKGLIPTIPEGALFPVIALIGTTVVPYNFFLHAARAGVFYKNTDDLELCRFDTAITISIGGIVTAAVLITAGTMLQGQHITSAADMAIQLEPLLGAWAKPFLSIGLFAAGFSSAITVPLGAAFTLAGLCGWGYDMSDRRFKVVAMSIVIIGIFISATGFNPLTIIQSAQALNGIILPITAIFLVYITSSKKQMLAFKNSPGMIITGIFVAAVMLVLGGNSLINAVSSLF